jgi:hypothetical protein
MGRGPHGDFRIIAEDTGQTRTRRAKAALSLRYPQSRATEICQWLECLSISRLARQVSKSSLDDANRPCCHSALDVNVRRREGDASRFAFGVKPGLIISCSFLRRAAPHPQPFANARVALLAVSHRQDLRKSRYTRAVNYLSGREAETIANGVAKLRQLLR